MQPSRTTHNHPQPPTTTHNHPQPPTTIHNHPQPPKKPPTTTHNLPQPPTTTQKTTHNHPQPTKNYPKKPKLVIYNYFTVLYILILKQALTLTVIRNNGIYMCVCVCVYMLYRSLYLLFFG